MMSLMIPREYLVNFILLCRNHYKSPSPLKSMKGVKKVFLGSDHAGFEVKEKLKLYFDRLGVKYEDMSPTKVDGDDYPDISIAVAHKVAETKGTRGILVCGSGEGVIIAANKVRGIRAVAVTDTKLAKLSRLHNDANVLGISEWHLHLKKIQQIVSVWLKTPFSEEQRHKRRIEKITLYEDATLT